ncbi:CMP-N-acetylneuraminate-beta-galactosamide-alpha-2,3-sialyltransferase 1-like [Scomber japonicus]|uniref:CMP-N-acetylneuraminate-beta-galactosamide- alpha-2,3-sialyltransferase 1-like n=1 Tax=Scomber japonicus TaxID=13676 RepID=UPI0023064648|nr:CMP-N-acetylneuraminate-beta-galactosamide-alpha-2,3-sialyltransferase 1-like [Scomber japonicus]
MLSRKTMVFITLLCLTTIGVFYRSGSGYGSGSRILSIYSSLCACEKCLIEGDPDFREIMKASPKPFLSREYGTTQDVFNWWKRLQSNKDPFEFYNKTVKNLFEIFPPIPPLIESSPDRCRTCAVVGNSGNLKGSHYGALIDFHDIVIRMNRGPIKGYEKDVGTKTTHRVMYPESSTLLDNTTHLVMFPFKIKDLLWLLQKFAPSENKAARRIANKNLVMILNPAFMKYVHEMWLKKKGRYPSTGFLTLALSMHMCDEINVFGFGADSDGNWYHYYGKVNKHLKTGPHPGGQEYDILQQLHKEQKIHFYNGWQ